jgi:hypothetical protein
MAVSIIQGDDYAHDYSLSSYKTLDSSWYGEWSIINKADFGSAGTPLASGSITISSDSKKLQLRIPPASTEDITVGATYMLIVEVSNDTLGFRREIAQEPLAIKPQGIPV